MIHRNVEKAKVMIEEGGDWDRRNRLKVYEGFYLMMIRQFSKAANLFLDTIATFTCDELFDYKTFVFYTIVISIVSLDRVSLKTKVIDSPEINTVIHEIPDLKSLMNSYYDGNYGEYFKSMADVLSNRIKTDRILYLHARFLAREMRIKAYTQFLESYRSVNMKSMSIQFGVTQEFLDRELSRFISLGRLNCKIDKVGGIIDNIRPDTKNAQYQSILKQGDLLLNRIQKLSRVINL